MRNVSLLALVALLACTSGALAGPFSDNFDGYASQAAFQAAWPAWNTANTTLSLAPPGPPPGGFDHTTGTTQGIAGVGSDNSGRNNRNFHTLNKPYAGAWKGTDADPVIWTFWLYDQDPASQLVAATYTGANRNFSELRAVGGDLVVPSSANGLTGSSTNTGIEGLVAMGLYTATVPYGRANYTVRTGFTWASTNIPRTAGWHEMKAVVGASAVTYYVDGVQASMSTAATAAWTTNMAWGGYQFDGIILGSGLTSWTTGNVNQPYDVMFDDVTLTPEPATLLVLAAGGLFLRRRRA